MLRVVRHSLSTSTDGRDVAPGPLLITQFPVGDARARIAVTKKKPPAAPHAAPPGTPPRGPLKRQNPAGGAAVARGADARRGRPAAGRAPGANPPPPAVTGHRPRPPSQPREPVRRRVHLVVVHPDRE